MLVAYPILLLCDVSHWYACSLVGLQIIIYSKWEKFPEAWPKRVPRVPTTSGSSQLSRESMIKKEEPKEQKKKKQPLLLQ